METYTDSNGEQWQDETAAEALEHDGDTLQRDLERAEYYGDPRAER